MSEEQQERRKRSEELLAWLKCLWGKLYSRAKEWLFPDPPNPDSEGLFAHLAHRWRPLSIRSKKRVSGAMFAFLLLIWIFISSGLAQFIGYLIGGLLLLRQIEISGQRATAAEETAKAMQKTARSTEKGNIDERFKNAIQHLGHQSASIRLGGIYALHHIAQEVDEYRERVFEILCAHIRETTTHETYEPRIIKPDQEKPEQEKPTIEIQSILNLLFIKASGGGIYEHEQFAANLENANLVGASLDMANLRRSDLQGADLQGADLLYADLQRADLRKADLRKAYLSDADLQRAYLQEANLQEAGLQIADLQRADLRKADLQRADLQGAYLQKADLLGANLQEAKLQGADLRYAHLQYAENLQIEQLLVTKTLYRAELPEGMEKEIRQENPEFFQEPSDEEDA